MFKTQKNVIQRNSMLQWNHEIIHIDSTREWQYPFGNCMTFDQLTIIKALDQQNSNQLSDKNFSNCHIGYSRFHLGFSVDDQCLT